MKSLVEEVMLKPTGVFGGGYDEYHPFKSFSILWDGLTDEFYKYLHIWLEGRLKNEESD